MEYQTLALLLMVVGFALIVAEVLLPSGGMISVLCVIAFAASIWCAHKAWWGDTQGYFWTFVGGLVVLIPGALIALFRFLEHSPMGDHVLLGAPKLEEVTPYQNEITHLTELVGRRGEALTLMTPGGMVSVEGERLHAISEGTLIHPGEAVEVMGVRGTRVIVRSLSEEAESGAAAGDSSLTQAESRDDDAPLDFEVPQG